MLSLYPYQKVGAEFLATSARAYLCDEMGLGKTPQAIVAGSMADYGGFGLVICPASVVANWRSELRAWGGVWGRSVNVVSYASAHHEQGEPYSTVILDEAHYAKNPEAKRTKVALGIAKKADRAWLLSGTPMPNDPRELYAPIEALWPEVIEALGIRDFDHWTTTFCQRHLRRVRKRRYFAITGSKNIPKLTAQLRGKWLRRLTKDVLKDLPDLRVDLFRLSLKESERAAVQRILASDEDWKRPKPNTRRDLGAIKGGAIGDLVDEELRNGYYDRVVVMFHHLDVAEVLRDRIDDATAIISGSLSAARRQAVIDEFNGGKFPVLLVQQQAGGTGINLQSSAEIILAEPDWSPDINRQAIKRIHRIGQTRSCRARIFAAPDTYDEKIMETIKGKILMQKEVGL